MHQPNLVSVEIEESWKCDNNMLVELVATSEMA